MLPEAARIVAVLQSAGRPLKPRDIGAALGLAAGDLPELRDLLDRLDADGVVLRLQRGRYAAPQRVTLVTGRLQGTRGGAAFLTPAGDGPDLFIPPDSLNSAMDGDRVVARVEKRGRADRPEGTIVQVLERARSTLVGTLRRVSPGGATRHTRYLVEPLDRGGRTVRVVAGAEPSADDGDLVVVRITDWGEDGGSLRGELAEVLGAPGSPGVDLLTVVHRWELPLDFPGPVEAAAAAAAGRQREATGEAAAREDFRGDVVFTIDPGNARDHDDALSIGSDGAGGWHVTVHIADVAYFVRPGDPVDAEAMRRGTSVYLPDRVVPMLPHSLSAGACSLQPGEDRLTLSLHVHLGPDGTTRGHRLVRGLIRSRHRLTYEEAQAVLDGRGSVAPDVDESLRLLDAAARAVRGARQRRGGLDLDVPEAEAVLDDAGHPVELRWRDRQDAHRLVEDLMVLANETIAARAEEAGLPFVYRVHEPPDPERLRRLSDLAAASGMTGVPAAGLGRGGTWRVPGPHDLQQMLQRAEGHPDHPILAMLLLRSMMQARYDTENFGHYGLGAPAYTHFTSPIRRYPDLLVHRLVCAAFIDGAAPDADADRLADAAAWCSNRERVAATAEREALDVMKARYMERHVGESFPGRVASVTGFGMFVALDPLPVEGLVHVSDLPDDYYELDEAHFALVGQRTGRRFRTGQPVRVRVSAVNVTDRRISFELDDAVRSGRGSH